MHFFFQEQVIAQYEDFTTILFSFLFSFRGKSCSSQRTSDIDAKILDLGTTNMFLNNQTGVL